MRTLRFANKFSRFQVQKVPKRLIQFSDVVYPTMGFDRTHYYSFNADWAFGLTRYSG